MERIIQVLRVIPGFIFGALIYVTAHADVLLVSPQADANSAEDGYPTSRFGEAPADPTKSTRADIQAPTRANRAPAGLVFDDEAGPTTRGGGSAETAPAPTARRSFDDRSLASTSAGLHQEPKKIEAPQSLIPDRTKGIQEIALIAGDLGFFPKTFFVSRDVPVRLFVTGASKKPLCVMMDSFQVRRQVTSARIEEITFTPNVPGQYRFYCPMNGMEGTMVVKELASAGE